MSNTSRRDFLKKNALGGLFCITGIPLMPIGNMLQSEDVKLDLFESSDTYEEINWNEVRKQFLLSKDKYYFNTASLGPSPKIVVTSICENLEDLGFRASDGHLKRLDTHKKVSELLNVSIEEIAVTRNATEGMNIVARSLPLKAGDEILLTKHEHIGGAAPWLALQKDIGVVIKLIELDLAGENNLEIIRDNITDKTKVVSFSHITCTTGMRMPAREIVELCRSKGIYTCIDGAQAVGMIPVDLKEINPDFYASSGHKWLFGPKGTGILFINKSVIEECSPIFAGTYTDSKFDLNSLTLEYRSVAQREEYGTRGAPITLGLGSAVNFISTLGIKNVAARGFELANHFRDGLHELSQVEILTPKNQAYYASIISFRVKGQENFSITQKLRNNEKDLRVRGIYENNLNGIRVSFSIFNSIEEVDYLLSALKEAISD